MTIKIKQAEYLEQVDLLVLFGTYIILKAKVQGFSITLVHSSS